MVLEPEGVLLVAMSLWRGEQASRRWGQTLHRKGMMADLPEEL